ncbi:MAG TPA: hypothetical protein PLA24_07285 [Tenuifilaceae bacterium]|nr:hypothetical protein [Tenuifilaceae bacterium]HRX32096.1 hypothetical protein [Tenuifilaceae bacterium]
MIGNQVLISFIIIAIAVWIALTIRDKRRSKNSDNSEDTHDEQ